MGLTRLSLKRPVSVIIIIAAIVIFGVSSIFSLNMQLMPEMEMPMFIVMTTYVGVSPEDIDELVTQKIEEVGGNLKGLKSMESISEENLSMVLFRYEYGTDMDDAYMDLLEEINSNKSKLPDDVKTPTIIEMNMNSMPVVTIAASAEGDVDLLHYVEDTVKPELERIKDVAQVNLSGGDDTYISVSIDPQKMNQYGLTMSSLVNYIKSADFTMPVGTAARGKQSMNVSISAEYSTTEQLEKVPLTTQKGQVITLADIATVTQKSKKSNSFSRYNGEEVVNISITKRQSAGDVEVATQVKECIERLSKDGVKFDITSDTSKDVISSLKSVGETLVLGMVLSMFILFLFFGDIKGSLIVGSSMPVSLLITFLLMKLMGFSLNVITMGGMVIGVGMMVDNSIVVLESCFRKRDDGYHYKEAAEKGTKFVMNSIIASTATTIAVFLPIALTKGLSGQFFKPLGFTIVFSLLASLISAITLVPLFFSKYKPVEKKNTPITKALAAISSAYSRLLGKVIRHKALAVIVSLVLLIGTGFAATLLNTELMPQADQGRIAISIKGKPGLKIEEYDNYMAGLEEFIMQNPDVEKYSLSADSSSGSGNITVFLKKDRVKETWETVEQWRLALIDETGFDVSIKEDSSDGMGSLGGATVDVTLVGSNLEDLKVASDMMREMMKEVPGVISVTSSADTSGSKAKIVVDPMKSAAVGFTPAMIANEVNMALSGVDTIDVTNNRKLYTVKVEYPEGLYTNVEDLNSLVMTSPSGKQILLSDVADVVYTDSAQEIARLDKNYSYTISATTTKKAKFDAEKEIKDKAEKTAYPGDVAIGSSTMDDMMIEEFTSLGIAIVVAIILVVMIMAMQFESIRFSMMVIWCIPFSLVGSIGLMLITGTTITMVSLMGILMLIGTVVNNGILFVDTANQLREDNHMEREAALMETGRLRLRPILMTTLTTILAMVPMALGIGEGTESMESMGMVIIGGFVASTFLTLLLLPVFYILMDRKKRKDDNPSGPRKFFKKRKNKKDNLDPEEREPLDDDMEMVQL